MKRSLRAAVVLSLLLPCGFPRAPRDDSAGAPRLPAAVGQWAPIAEADLPAALKSLRQAVDLYAAKNYAAAFDALPSPEDAARTATADYALYYRAASLLRMDRFSEALESFRRLEKQYPGSSLLPDALLGQCQALLKLQDAKSLLSMLDHPSLKKTSETLYYRARALEMAGKKTEAAEQYLRVYAGYPKSEHSDAARRGLSALSPGALQGRRNYGARLERAEGLLRASDARGARPLLVALGTVTAPDPASARKRRFLLADAEYRVGRTSVALTHLGKVAAADDELHAKAIRLQASCYRRLKQESRFIAQRDKALSLYPESRETEEICYSAATYFDVNYESAKARNAYQTLLEKFPKGRHSQRALWKLAIIRFASREYGEAAAAFWSHLRQHPAPASAGPAIYWLGRCYEALGGRENARTLYRRVQALANESYYGIEAGTRAASLAAAGGADRVSIAGIDFAQVTAACDAVGLPAAAVAEPGRGAWSLAARARELWSAGLSDLAVAELQWAARQHPRDEPALSCLTARIYAESGDHYNAIVSLRGAFPAYILQPVEALPLEVWQLLYPVHLRDTVSPRAAENGLDPSLVLGLIRQESAFNEKARSSAGARGLMQILPSTGKTLARRAGIKRYSAARLYEAGTNVALGVRFLSSLLERFGGAELALAAYNAGPSRVDRWLKEYGGGDIPLFVEQIPFGETRGYVKQVMSNRALYGRLAPSASPGGE